MLLRFCRASSASGLSHFTPAKAKASVVSAMPATTESYLTALRAARISS